MIKKNIGLHSWISDDRPKKIANDSWPPAVLLIEGRMGRGKELVSTEGNIDHSDNL